ncbi:MAG: glycosyltransferase family 4 protein [Acidobacteriota bacterium]
MTLKVLIVYERVYPDFIGGIEHRNYELGAALARRGHGVTLVGFCRPLPGVPPRLEVKSLGPLASVYRDDGRRSTRQALRFASRLWRLDVRGFDVIETASVPYVHLLPLALRCRLAGKPLMVTWYEYWSAYWKGYVGRWRAPIYRTIEWLAAQLGTQAIATCLLTQGRLTRRRWRGGVGLLPCGIRFADVQQAAVTASAAAGGPPGAAAPPLIFAGRLLAEKRVDLLLRAVALLAATRPGKLLTVFGDGPDRRRLEAMAADLAIAARVDFHGHVETSAEVWGALGRARIAVQPSEREGFGLFPLEAMAAGLPVVYCQSPESAVPELVRDGIEGIEAAATPEGLAAAIAGLLDDETARTRFRQRALDRASQYDWELVAEQFEQACLALLSRHRQ